MIPLILRSLLLCSFGVGLFRLWRAAAPPERSLQWIVAAGFLARAIKNEAARAGDPNSEGRERLKSNYEETAYRQLQAELQSKK